MKVLRLISETNAASDVLQILEHYCKMFSVTPQCTYASLASVVINTATTLDQLQQGRRKLLHTMRQCRRAGISTRSRYYKKRQARYNRLMHQLRKTVKMLHIAEIVTTAPHSEWKNLYLFCFLEKFKARQQVETLLEKVSTRASCGVQQGINKGKLAALQHKIVSLKKERAELKEAQRRFEEILSQQNEDIFLTERISCWLKFFC